MDTSLFLLVYGAIIIGVVISMWLKRRRQGKRDGFLSGKNGKSKFPGKGKGIYQGIEYTYEYFSGTGDQSSSFKISVACSSEGEFRVVRENAFDVFFKKLGVSREIQTGDPDFDRDFYILTDTVDFATAYFSDEARRRAIRRLFSSGITEVRLNRETLKVQWTPFELSGNPDPAFIEKAVDAMGGLTKEIPRFFRRSVNPDSSGFKWKRRLGFGVPVFLSIAGGISIVAGMDLYRPLDLAALFIGSLRYSLPCLALFLWLAFLWLRGRASSHRELFILCSLSFSAYLIAGFGGLMVWNGFGDHEEAAVFESVTAVEKYEKKSDSGTTYYVGLRSWRGEGRVERLKIPRNFYGEIIPGKTVMTVSVKPGRLGFEWLYSLRLESGNGREA